MAWLAVNKNGNEVICNNRPDRGSLIKRKHYNKDRHRFEYNKEDVDFWEDTEIIGGECVYFHIYLPKGTIKKLIGREITWDDDPVELSMNI